MDENYVKQSRLCAFFEPETAISPNVRGLGFSWRTTITSARSRFAAVTNVINADVAIYHNLWGLSFLADLDQFSRRTGLLHSDVPGLREVLRANRGLLDGVLCVSNKLADLAMDLLPELRPDRIALLPLPVATPPGLRGRSSSEHRPLTIGYCGRVTKEQKRVDRMPALVRELDRQGLNFEIEVLGEGSESRWLAAQFSGRTNVKLLGRLTGPDYWNALARWDVMFFLSDYEGLPIALLEGMSLGVVPVFPKIGSGGDDYTADVDEELLYEPGNMEDCAQKVKRFASLGSGASDEIRSRARKRTAANSWGSYLEVFFGFVEAIQSKPRISRSTFGPRPMYLTDSLPFALLGRFAPRCALKPLDRVMPVTGSRGLEATP